MSKPEFVYVTYIKTTPEKLWHALTDRETNALYWFGAHQESDWKVGSPWKIAYPDGRVMDSGEILELEPLKRIVIKWRNEWSPELNAEGYSRCTMQIEEADGAVKLTVMHVIDRETSKFIEGVSGGWPKILSNLKSLLETGAVAVQAKKNV
jgi:uncharacterized protein YndB with AHSA1/START domain